MSKTYELFLHYKQGDDLSGFVEQTKTHKDALLAWADFMESNAKALRELVNLFKGKKLTIEQADTHFIAISGDKKCLEKAVEKGILSVQDFEEEEEEEEA